MLASGLATTGAAVGVAAEAGALEVKTKMPSDVAGSPSPPFFICRKKPLDFRAVTIPLVVTLPGTPMSGDVTPLP